jgi:hypothetical protein
MYLGAIPDRASFETSGHDLSLTGDQLCNALINLPSIWPVTGRP